MTDKFRQYLRGELEIIKDEMKNICDFSTQLIVYNGSIQLTQIPSTILRSAYESSLRLRAIADMYRIFYGESDLPIKKEQIDQGLSLLEEALQKDLKT